MTPTILIFLKAPVPGQAKTRLAAGVGDDLAMEIYQKLVHRQMAALPPDWPAEVHFAPAHEERLMRAWVGESAHRTFHPQIEADLGERLTHAMHGAFARGAAAVMLIGGDCPGLDQTALQAAARRLLAREVIMGPSADGGYYLLGMSRALPQLFQDVAWGTSTVAERTREIARRHGLVWGELPTLRDVDEAEDWAAVSHLFD